MALTKAHNRMIANAAVNVKDFGAVGDGVTDDTAAIQAAIDSGAGKTILFPEGNTYLISSPLTLYSNSTYMGGAKIKQKNSANISGSLFSGTSLNNILIDGLELDANQSNNAAAQTYGIILELGNNNTIRNCYIHDTTQSGIQLESESGSKIVSNHIIDCGINLGTDNHGIMVISTTSTPLSNILISGNIVDNAYRKGITVYNASPGVVSSVVISNNVVSNCNTGGIYVSNPSAAVNGFITGVCITGNNCSNNYVNILISTASGCTVSGNTCIATSGGQGIFSADIKYSSFSGNSVVSSDADGLKLIGITVPCTGNSITGNMISLSSQAGSGSYHAINLNGATYSCITGNTLLGEDASPKQGYGILEAGSSNYNRISDNSIYNTQSGSQVLIAGNNTSYNINSALLNGFNIVSPSNTVDINGGLSIRNQAIILSNGANNDVTLPAKSGCLYVAGPTAIYNISGIDGGTDGKKITIFNYTNYTMTLNHNSGSSTAGNRVLIGGSADLAISAFGSIELLYVGAASAWTVVGYKA